MTGKTKLYIASSSENESPAPVRTRSKHNLKVAYDRSAERIDLSGTVNHYGPPKAVVDALGEVSPRDLRMPAWEAAGLVLDCYAVALGAPADELVPFRGVGDFVGAVRSTLAHDRISLPLPAPSGLLKAFPGRALRSSSPGSLPNLALVNDAMSAYEVVFVGNPNHLVGMLLDPSGLVEVAMAHPESTLVVDESYIDFLDEPSRETLVGASTDNVVVLRTTAKFFALTAGPVAVAWCGDPSRIAQLTGRSGSVGEQGRHAAREARQIGGLDALATAQALECAEWAARAKLVLTYDALWLSQRLSRISGRVIEHDVGVHFRTVLSRHARLMEQVFRSHGVQVLELRGSRLEGPRGIRVMAPTFEGQALVEAAVDEIAERVSGGAREGRASGRDGLRSDAGT